MPEDLPQGLLRPEIESLPRYNSGLAPDQFARLYGCELVAKLDSNENPHGPAPSAVEALRAMATMAWRYPDAGTRSLCTALAREHDCDVDRIVTGDGSEDLIDAIYRAVLRPGDRVLTVCPSFGLHELSAVGCGAEVTKLVFEPDWRFPTEALARGMVSAPRILVLSSPSNPVGVAMERSDFERLIGTVQRHTLLLFDEAYVEYVQPGLAFDAPALLAKTNLAWASLRTFSKAWGLAGARIGYGVFSHREFASAVMKTRMPFAVNAFAASAAQAALSDRAHLQAGVAGAVSERSRIEAGLATMGFALAPSSANFVFFDTGRDAGDFAEALRHRGVLIKPWVERPFTDWARVSTGTSADTDVFLDAVRQIA